MILSIASWVCADMLSESSLTAAEYKELKEGDKASRRALRALYPRQPERRVKPVIIEDIPRQGRMQNCLSNCIAEKAAADASEG
jgi:hypothetical protein